MKQKAQAVIMNQSPSDRAASSFRSSCRFSGRDPSLHDRCQKGVRAPLPDFQESLHLLPVKTLLGLRLRASMLPRSFSHKKNPAEAGLKDGGGGRIRTFETMRCQIYSLMRLTASLPHHLKLEASHFSPFFIPGTGMVPKVGVEPTLPHGNRILNPARLPVPPLRHE